MDLEREQTSGLTAQQEIILQKDEIIKQGIALECLNTELLVERKEKRKRSAALVIANQNLVFEEREKGKRAQELGVANAELIVQEIIKVKSAKDLVVANRKLNFRVKYLKECAANLRQANRNMVKMVTKKESAANKLKDANSALKMAQALQKEHIGALQKMMHILSHKLRQPIVQIKGLTNILDADEYTSKETKDITTLIIQSAELLDSFTRELTTFIHLQEMQASSKPNNKIE